MSDFDLLFTGTMNSCMVILKKQHLRIFGKCLGFIEEEEKEEKKRNTYELGHLTAAGAG